MIDETNYEMNSFPINSDRRLRRFLNSRGGGGGGGGGGRDGSRGSSGSHGGIRVPTHFSDEIVGSEIYQEASESLHRFLKGGGGRGGGGSSGGRGGSSGGGSRGGGSSYGGGRGTRYYGYGQTSNSSGNCYGDSCKIPFWLVIFLPILGGLGLICCCCWASKRTSSSSSDEGPEEEFKECVQKANKDAEISSSSATIEPDQIFSSYEGDFEVTYYDRGQELSGNMALKLVNNELLRGYNITGSNSDSDGPSYILDGFVHYSGHAWWVDEVESGEDKGLRVLNKGLFNFETNTFAGSWRGSSGESGIYLSCISTNATKLFGNTGDAGNAPQTLQGMLTTDIPTVYAAAETGDDSWNYSSEAVAVPVVASAIPYDQVTANFSTAVPPPAPSAPPSQPQSSQGPSVYVPNY